MDRNVAELAAVKEAVSEVVATSIEQLSELELLLVGGGIADTIL
jgi:hypothetical protein